MDHANRRRKLWDRAYVFIYILAMIYRLLPRKLAVRNFESTRFSIGWIAMAKRYAYLKRLGAKLGKGYCIIQPNVCIFHPEKLVLGNNVTINENSYLECSGVIEIGNDVLIGHGVSILSNTHNYQRIDIPVNCQGESKAKVKIGNNVWIGAKATILLGVTIGDNCVVGANAVVNKSVGDNQIVGGVPAKVIKSRGIED